MAAQRQKTPAQLLFERIIRTWVFPEIQKRVDTSRQAGPIHLRSGLLLWKSLKGPTIYLNDETGGMIETINIKTARPIKKDEEIRHPDIRGIERIKLNKQYWGRPYIFICQGENERYYIAFGKLGFLEDGNQFKLLKKALGYEGLQLTSEEGFLKVYIDLLKNSYIGTPAQKRAFTLQLKRLQIDEIKRTAVDKVKRHLRLPTLIIHDDDEIRPLLLEARNTYIDGHFFSCIASTATVADRICNNLIERYEIDKSIREQIIQEETLGQKIPRLQSFGLITSEQAAVLESINRIRNKHIHPKSPITELSMKRDALRAISLLHEFLENTVSVFRDYTIEDGRLVPKPIS